MQKYAQMSGGMMNEEEMPSNDGSDMIFVDENGKELDPDTVKMMLNQEGIM